MLQHRHWAQYQPHPDGASTSILHFMFFPVTSARPLHFPLPPRYPTAEARTCNTVPWAQLLKWNNLNHTRLKQAPHSPCAHTNSDRLTNFPGCSHTCSGENKRMKNTCYLMVCSDSVLGRSPAPRSTLQSQSCRQASHIISAQFTTDLTGPFSSFFFFFKDGKTLSRTTCVTCFLKC